MAWHHVADETTRVPQYATQSATVVVKTLFGPMPIETVRSSNVPLGTFKEITQSIWRCGGCRALAVSQKGDEPSPCSRCK